MSTKYDPSGKSIVEVAKDIFGDEGAESFTEMIAATMTHEDASPQFTMFKIVEWIESKPEYEDACTAKNIVPQQLATDTVQAMQMGMLIDALQGGGGESTDEDFSQN